MDDKDEADRLIEKAKLCLRSGRKDRALQLLYEAQNIYPSTRARGIITVADAHSMQWQPDELMSMLGN